MANLIYICHQRTSSFHPYIFKVKKMFNSTISLKICQIKKSQSVTVFRDTKKSFI